MNQRTKTNDFVYSDQEILNGTPCFKGTRVPVYRVFDQLALGWSIEDLKDIFPSVKTRHIQRLLQESSEIFRSTYEKAEK